MLLKEIIQVYFLVQTFVLLCFFSPLKGSIISLISKNKFFSNDDFDTFLILKNKYLGKLLSCTFCFTFWSSVICSFILISSTLLDILLSICVSITLNFIVLKYINNK